MVELEAKRTERNVSRADNILAYLNFLRNKIATFNLYRKAFENYFSILFMIVKKRYPVVAILRNSKNRIVLRNEKEIALVAYTQIYKDMNLDLAKKQITFTALYSERKNLPILRFVGGMESGDIVHIFFQHVYRQLPVEGKIVIDIGAQIADSSIYFSIKGASKVIAIEPMPRNYEIARNNIMLNGMSQEINLIWAACGGEASKYPSEGVYPDSGALKQTPILTLKEILDKRLADERETLVLKMDCEGYEYPIILTAEEETLRRFSHMQIEYHCGYRNLKRKLENSGFVVSVGRPSAFRLSESGRSSMLSGYKVGQWQLTGYIYARR
jgi:FkbM family methyltransferase